MAFSHSEACLWIDQSALSRPEEESRVAAGGLRAHQSLLAPQAFGPAWGIVSLEAGKRPAETINSAAKPAFHPRFVKNHKLLGFRLLSFKHQQPVQSFPRS